MALLPSKPALNIDYYTITPPKHKYTLGLNYKILQFFTIIEHIKIVDSKRGWEQINFFGGHFMGKKYHTLFYRTIFLKIMILVLTHFGQTLQATPLDDFLFHPFFNDIFQGSITLHVDNKSIWNILKETNFIKENTAKIAAQLNKKMKAIDPVVFTTALQKLVLECNIPLPQLPDTASLLKVLLIYEKLDPSEEYTSYLFLNFINTIADFLTAHPKDTTPDYTNLTKKLTQTLTETVTHIKNATSQEAKKPFFKKKSVLLLLLLLSISIVIGIIIGIKMQNDDEEAEQERIHQEEEDTQAIKKSAMEQISQSLNTTTKAISQELAITKDVLEKLKTNLEKSKELTSKQLDELAKSIDVLNANFEFLVKDYQQEKEKLAQQQTTFDTNIATSKKRLAEITKQYNAAMEKLGPQMEDALGNQEEKKQKQSAKDTPCSMADISKGVDVAEKGLKTAESAYSVLGKIFGSKDEKEPSLQERLEKLRKETPDFSINAAALHAQLSV